MTSNDTEQFALELGKADTKLFSLELAKADSESEVIAILKEAGYWNETSSWHEYGGHSQNLSIIGNQQSSGDNALVEKLINSVDAVLMRECIKKKIDPSSKQAPKSIVEAQRQFFNIYDGKLSSLDSRQRTQLAQNIWLVASGKKTQPSFSIIDKGEGQSPARMPKTILSLIRTNKNKIGFVQGKFGMGGSGVLRFCAGEHRVLLIISKRNHEIDAEFDEYLYDKDETRNSWGVTVVRCEPPKEGEKNSHYTYLAPQGKILSFAANELPLLPGEGMHPNPFGYPLQSGTFIKLYEYDIGSGLQSAIFFNLYYRLSLLIPDIALPLTLLETREYTAITTKKTLAGLSVRLDEDTHENLEPNFPSTGQMIIDNEELDYSIYAFKISEKDNTSKKTNYAKEGVIFSINGQTQGSLSKTFFSRKEVKMNYLADSILVIIDCSKMTRRKQEDLFMSSRDRLANIPIRSLIEKELAKIIKDHDGLKELRNSRRQEMIDNRLREAKPLKDILDDVIKNSPVLSQLLDPGRRISNPFKLEGTANKKKKFEGKEFPSYFKLVEKYKRRQFSINNKSFFVKYETDAKNDYFKRDKEPGEITVKCGDMSVSNFNINIWNGLATLTITPKDKEVGDELRFETEITDPSRVNSFTDNFVVCINNESQTNSSNSGKTNPSNPEENPPGNKQGKGRHKPSSLDIPDVTRLTKEQWNEPRYRMFKLNDRSALRVMDSGDNYDFFINMDNVYLKSEIKDSKIDPHILEARYEHGMVLLGMSILNFGKADEKDNSNNSSEWSLDNQVSQFTDAAAPFLLPMIANLGGDLESHG